ncbi:MAG: hypothetical protein ISS26_03740 [Candidatus Omnitrophica bacterium]|nr:hypothetical protein [Candidatus Omnitrophota bacterium]
MVKIEKEEQNIVAYIGNYKVRGTIFMPQGARLSDFLGGVGQKQYIPVVDVTISDASDRLVCKADFLELNKDRILFLFPENKGKEEADKER